ncbi:unnamed protein product [Lymnaea stagnalis]|uniref:Uncharacterized protein n=1 Tax=Lymnaea stagnalis TaxID=6523 RepID=A0AAV2ITT7_LYMST
MTICFHLSGCEYGDLASGCVPDMCAPTSAGRNSCCETCNLGTPFRKSAQKTLPASTRTEQEDANMTNVNGTDDKGNKIETDPPGESGISPLVIALPMVVLLCLACYGASNFFRKKKPRPPPSRIQVDLLTFAPEPRKETALTVDAEESESKGESGNV